MKTSENNKPTYNEVVKMLEDLNAQNEEDQRSGFEEGIYDNKENESNKFVADFIARAKNKK